LPLLEREGQKLISFFLVKQRRESKEKNAGWLLMSPMLGREHRSSDSQIHEKTKNKGASIITLNVRDYLPQSNLKVKSLKTS
jgi:hypothetical protein